MTNYPVVTSADYRLALRDLTQAVNNYDRAVAMRLWTEGEMVTLDRVVKEKRQALHNMDNRDAAGEPVSSKV